MACFGLVMLLTLEGALAGYLNRFHSTYACSVAPHMAYNGKELANLFSPALSVTRRLDLDALGVCDQFPFSGVDFSFIIFNIVLVLWLHGRVAWRYLTVTHESISLYGPTYEAAEHHNTYFHAEEVTAVRSPRRSRSSSRRMGHEKNDDVFAAKSGRFSFRRPGGLEGPSRDDRSHSGAGFMTMNEGSLRRSSRRCSPAYAAGSLSLRRGSGEAREDAEVRTPQNCIPHVYI